MDFFAFVRRAARRDIVLAFLALVFAAQNAFAIVLPKTRHVGPSATNCDFTTIKVTYYDVVGLDGQLTPFESFTLRRPRRD